MIKISWCSLINIKSMEDYYHNQSLKGYHLKDCWHGFSKMKKGTPQDYEYFIVMDGLNGEKAKAKVHYGNEENEFEYVCSSYGVMIFRKDANKITENDIALKREQYRQCAKINKIGLYIALLAIPVFVILEFFTPERKLYEVILSILSWTLITGEIAYSFYEHRKFSLEFTSIDQRYPDKLRLARFLGFIAAIVWEIYCYGWYELFL